jgi:hypothetical protein
MTNSAQDQGQQKPETVEDLAPRDEETAELKGGCRKAGDVGIRAAQGGDQ